jgi:hypothetical protein
MPIRKLDKPQGPTTVWLLGLIEEYLTINEMDNDGQTFGWLSTKDITMVQRLRDGGDITLTKMDEVLAFMQLPVNSYRTSARTGAREIKTLKPLTIKPRSIPHD